MRANQIKREQAVPRSGEPGHFDEEKVFDSDIQPLLEQIRATALAHSMPFVLAVGYGNTPNAGYATASTVCTVDGRTGAELYVAAKILSNPSFAHLVMELLAKAGPATADALREPAPSKERLM